LQIEDCRLKNTVALILVDLQTAAFDGAVIPKVHAADQLSKNASTLLRTARDGGIPLVHIQHCGEADSPFAETAPGWPIFGPIAPHDQEQVVRKRADNAFEGTDLHERLQRIGARTVIVAGLQTEHCVAATCRGALELGYGVQLAQNAHSTWPDGDRSAEQIIAAETAALAAEGVILTSTDDLVVLFRTDG
jgi:nicotinamidase-related amidase